MGGWLNRNWIQVGYQLALACADALWAFCVSTVILVVMNYIPGLKLRASEEQETAGMDDAELGEFAVSHCFLSLKVKLMTSQYDYVEASRETEKVREPSVRGFPVNEASSKEAPTDSMKPFMPVAQVATPASPSIPPPVGM